MAHLKLTPLKLGTWRKIALGTWRTVGDPTVYATFEINVTKILARQKKWTETKGTRAPTLTTIVAKATANTLKKHPQINGMIRWGKIYLRDSVTLFLQTAVDDEGTELSGVTIPNAENKSIEEISAELLKKAQAIRQDKDPAFKKTKSMFSVVPAFLMRYLLNFSSYILYTLNINPPFLGLPKDPFGSIMITSVGMLGVDEAYAPLVPYSRVPMLLAICATRDTPIVVDGKITIAPIFKVCGTFDHRFVDGVYGAKMLKTVKSLLETDEGLDKIGM